MKRINQLFLIFFMTFTTCKTEPDKTFKPIPSGLFQTANLMRKIQPQINYEHWACILSNPLSVEKTKVVTGQGNINYIFSYPFIAPHFGFKNELYIGYYYIIYLKDKNIQIIKTLPELITFLGKINTLQKALIIANIQGFNVDYSRTIGSSFKEVENGFEFYLVKYHQCTVRTEPFKINIDTNGNFNATSLNFYYNIDDNTCID